MKNSSFDGCSSDEEIANLLASHHKLNCSPDSPEIDAQLKSDFLCRNGFSSSDFLFPEISFSTVMIEEAIKKISNNTASGLDNITIEHFKWSHPSVLFILKTIFNIFTLLKEVPLDFGGGLVTPIPKFKGHKIKVSPDDFRCITVNSIVSKIFEHCILPFFNKLKSSSRQFGFKQGTGCPSAINLLKNTVQYFNKKGFTINLGLIDIRKAFDKTNTWGILGLLQKNHINPALIDVLAHWFSIGSAIICWNNTLSEPVTVSSGVRQGGILSPLFFHFILTFCSLNLRRVI